MNCMKKVIVLFLTFLGLSGAIHSQNMPIHALIENQIIIQLDAGISPRQFANNHSKLGLIPIKKPGQSHNIHLFEWKRSIPFSEVRALLENDPSVIAQQANYRVNFYGEPNDSLFSEQWNMAQLNMPAVWDFGTGGVTANGDTVVIAIVDSGFNINHPDLSGNVWQNRGEIPNNEIDDDQNGFIDDVYGWNFREDSPIHGLSKHGHAVAGLAGAVGNNKIGISGINQTVKLMLLDIFAIDEIIASYEYIYDQRDKYNKTNGQEGSFIVANNASWGIDKVFCSDMPVLEFMYAELGKVGILTAAAPSNNFYNVDISGDIPVTCTSSSVIGVLNTDSNNQKEATSSYGKKSINIGIPGDGVPSLNLTGYKLFSGNSAAAPQLAGAIGLLYSLACPDIVDQALSAPEETALLFKEILLKGAEKFAGLKNYCSTGGRLNMKTSFDYLQSTCKGSSGTLEILSISPNPGNFETKIIYQSPNFEDYHVVVYNSLGQKIQKLTISPFVFGDKYFTLDISNYPVGMYEITIFQGKEMVAGKLIKH